MCLSCAVYRSLSSLGSSTVLSNVLLAKIFDQKDLRANLLPHPFDKGTFGILVHCRVLQAFVLVQYTQWSACSMAHFLFPPMLPLAFKQSQQSNFFGIFNSGGGFHMW